MSDRLKKAFETFMRGRKVDKTLVIYSPIQATVFIDEHERQIATLETRVATLEAALAKMEESK